MNGAKLWGATHQQTLKARFGSLPSGKAQPRTAQFVNIVIAITNDFRNFPIFGPAFHGLAPGYFGPASRTKPASLPPPAIPIQEGAEGLNLRDRYIRTAPT